MPFRPRGDGKFTSPSGRVWTLKQIALYHATKGFTRKPKAAKPKRQDR